ncbi:unnamed protein product, partial [marine sediment metagenome]
GPGHGTARAVRFCRRGRALVEEEWIIYMSSQFFQISG